MSIAVTEMVQIPVFESRLAIFRVRANFIAPYRKCRFFYLDHPHLKTKNAFIKRVEEIAASWPNGTYYLKLSNGQVFARFDMYNGKVKILYKNSPVTGKLYPLWAFF